MRLACSLPSSSSSPPLPPLAPLLLLLLLLRRHPGRAEWGSSAAGSRGLVVIWSSRGPGGLPLRSTMVQYGHNGQSRLPVSGTAGQTVRNSTYAPRFVPRNCNMKIFTRRSFRGVALPPPPRRPLPVTAMASMRQSNATYGRSGQVRPAGPAFPVVDMLTVPWLSACGRRPLRLH